MFRVQSAALSFYALIPENTLIIQIQLLKEHLLFELWKPCSEPARPWPAPWACRGLHPTHPALGAGKACESCPDGHLLFCISTGHNTHTIPVSATERNPSGFYLPILWTTQSCWQRGQRLFCFTHKDMQQLWKEWLHSPQTTEREERTYSSHTQLSINSYSNIQTITLKFITTGSFRQNRSSLIYPLRSDYYNHPDDSEFHHQAFYFLPNIKKGNAYILTFLYKVTGVCFV